MHLKMPIGQITQKMLGVVQRISFALGAAQPASKITDLVEDFHHICLRFIVDGQSITSCLSGIYSGVEQRPILQLQTGLAVWAVCKVETSPRRSSAFRS